MRKHVLIALAISGVLAVALGFVFQRFGLVLRAQQKPSPSVTVNAWPTNLRKYDDVASLVRESDLVALGTVVSKVSQRLPPAEKLIVTDYSVTAGTLLKGTLPPAQTLRVRTTGGRVDFGDGTSAEVKMPDFWKSPEVGKSYVFFLEKREAGYFVLRGGPQGFFEITPDGVVKPQVRPEDKLMQNYNDRPALAFLQEVRRAVK